MPPTCATARPSLLPLDTASPPRFVSSRRSYEEAKENAHRGRPVFSPFPRAYGNGEVDACHARPLVACTSNNLVRFAESLYARYWARTSDPQLVEMGRPFASVRWSSLRRHR